MSSRPTVVTERRGGCRVSRPRSCLARGHGKRDICDILTVGVKYYVFLYKIWDPYREGQISALDRVQKKAAKFAHHTNSPKWETLASLRKLSRICALVKAYSGEPAWKPIGDRLQRPLYLSSVDHERKISSRRQRTDVGKYSFVNRTIQHWNHLPA